MKKLFVVLCIVIASFISGCSNSPSSSGEEAIYTVHQLEDFKEIIWYNGVLSKYMGIGLGATPVFFELSKKDDETYFSHEIIYKTKGGGFKLVFMDNSRPPQIVKTVEFNP